MLSIANYIPPRQRFDLPAIDGFKRHPFNFLWKGPAPKTEAELAEAYTSVGRRAADLIYHNEPQPVSPDMLGEIFMPYHQNGTFVIGERQVWAPGYLRGEVEGFDNWAKQVTMADLDIMELAGELPGEMTYPEKIITAQVVAEALQYFGSQDRLWDLIPICDLIPNQNYIDYIRRAIGLFLYHNVDQEFDTEREYNSLGREVALAIVSDKLRNENNLKKLMLYSLYAGVMGLDMKCSFCAASTFDRKNSIWLGGYDDSISRIEGVYAEMRAKSEPPLKIYRPLFAWDKYQELVLNQPCSLAFFPDDLPETIFDMFQLQRQMGTSPQLRLTIVPRAGRYHNDAAYQDVIELLDEPVFAGLRRFQDQGRLFVSDKGPRSGAVEGPKLSVAAAELVLGADVLYFKGSRTYELLATGIRKPSFFGQTVSREFSESITGLDAQAMIPMLQHVEAFPAFWGFNWRPRRSEPLFPTGRMGWQVAMTAMESADFTSSPKFLALLAQHSRESVALQLVEKAWRQGHGAALHKVEY